MEESWGLCVWIDSCVHLTQCFIKPDSVLDSEDIELNKTDKIPTVWNIVTVGEKDDTKVKSKIQYEDVKALGRTG